MTEVILYSRARRDLRRFQIIGADMNDLAQFLHIPPYVLLGGYRRPHVLCLEKGHVCLLIYEKKKIGN